MPTAIALSSKTRGVVVKSPRPAAGSTFALRMARPAAPIVALLEEHLGSALPTVDGLRQRGQSGRQGSPPGLRQRLDGANERLLRDVRRARNDLTAARRQRELDDPAVYAGTGALHEAALHEPGHDRGHAA